MKGGVYMKKNFVNNKANKSATNNQWPSSPKDHDNQGLTNKKEKTPTDNQWTSTNKDDVSQQ
jgi:hypothetical protein